MVTPAMTALAFSTPLQIASVGVVVVCVLLARGFGRWLMRKGSAMERTRHGALPGGYMDPARSARQTRDERPAPGPAEPDRYDPFDAG